MFPVRFEILDDLDAVFVIGKVHHVLVVGIGIFVEIGIVVCVETEVHGLGRSFLPRFIRALLLVFMNDSV